MKQVSLGEVTKIQTGKIDVNRAVAGGEYPFFTCSREAYEIDDAPYEGKAVLVAGNGDLNVKYYEGKFNAYQRTYFLFVNDENVLLPKFLYWFLESYIEKLRSESSGSTIKYIKMGNLTDASLTLPSLETQIQIVEKIDKAFAEIDSLEKNLELKEEKTNQLLQSMINAALNNDKFEKKIVTLDQICENLDSQRIPITREARTVGKYPYYGASGIIDYVEDFIFEGNALLVSEDGANLLARSTPIAFSVTGKYWVNNHAHVLRFTDQNLQEYVKHFLEDISLDKFVTGAAQPKLTQRALNNIPIQIPLNQIDIKSVSEGLSNLKELTFLIMENLIRKRKLADELKSAFLSKFFGQQVT